MKLDWRSSLILFCIAAIIEFVFSSSHIGFLLGIEPLMIFFIAIIATKHSNLPVFLYLFFALLMDLTLMHPVGMSSLSLFFSYLLTKVVNRVFNLMGEAKLLFNLIVIILAIIFRQIINQILTGQSIELNLLTMGIASLMYVVLHGIISKLFAVNAYTR